MVQAYWEISKQIYIACGENERAEYEGDNPPIGIVLCADKSDAIVKFTLSENDTQIFVSKYMTYIPSEEEFKRELRLDDYKKKDDLPE